MDTQWLRSYYSDSAALSLRVKKKLFEEHSAFQKVSVYDTHAFGKVLLLDDAINVTERDEYIYHEMLTHVPLFTHPSPETVLVVGGGDGGIIREVVKHACVHTACLVDIDPLVTTVSETYFPAVSCSLHDERVRIHHDDASAFVRKSDTVYDCIIIDSTDPVGPGKKLFTEEFYHNCCSSLADNGIMCAQSESPFFDPHIVSAMYEKARHVFPIVKMYIAFMPSYVSGIWSFMFCSKLYDPPSLFQQLRYESASLNARYYNDRIHAASFVLPTFLENTVTP